MLDHVEGFLLLLLPIRRAGLGIQAVILKRNVVENWNILQTFAASYTQVYNKNVAKYMHMNKLQAFSIVVVLQL